ncbi:MAG: hypothetical protein AB2746_16830, partial [Candidatus Thiodiazotropha taylori]
MQLDQITHALLNLFNRRWLSRPHIVKGPPAGETTNLGLVVGFAPEVVALGNHRGNKIIQASWNKPLLRFAIDNFHHQS